MVKVLCPVCKSKLCDNGKSLICTNGHLFDKSKESYVNLLPANAKNSADPGDNALMIASRKSFLNENYYLPLAKKLSETITSYFNRDICVLDAGTGTGYYMNVFNSVRGDLGFKDELYCVDISKHAAKTAAKSLKTADVYVASVYDLPFDTDTFDAVVSVFSPFADKEYARVLVNGGLLFSVTPANNHLLEIRKFLYDEIRPNDTELNPTQLTRIEKINFSFGFTLKSAEEMSALLSMTPYYYRTPQSALKKLEQYETFDSTADFNISVFKK